MRHYSRIVEQIICEINIFTFILRTFHLFYFPPKKQLTTFVELH